MKRFILLIVDDEQRFADMLARRLNLRGCVCDVAYSGQEALDILDRKRKEFDLVLLDLRLPDLYGVEVLVRIKQMDPNPPVIIVTAHGTEEDREACMQQGAYAFMHKPVKIEELMRILAQLGEKAA